MAKQTRQPHQSKAGRAKLSDRDTQRLTRKLQGTNRVAIASAAHTYSNPLAPPPDIHSELFQHFRSAVFHITAEMHRGERGRVKGQKANKHQIVFSEALQRAQQEARSTHVEDIKRWFLKRRACSLSVPSGTVYVYVDADDKVELIDNDDHSIKLDTLLKNRPRYLK